MFKIMNFFHIYVLIIIADMVIAQRETCAEDLSEVISYNCGKLDPSGKDEVLEKVRCSYNRLGLIDENGQYIEPRTHNEGILITHAQALENCVHLLFEKSAEITDASYYACITQAEDELNKAYDCSL